MCEPSIRLLGLSVDPFTSLSIYPFTQYPSIRYHVFYRAIIQLACAQTVL
jgi:hypothetical protein